MAADTIRQRSVAREATFESWLIGRSLGRYHVEVLIAVGGMGRVFRARDTRLGRKVAIKIPASRNVGDSDTCARFETELQLAGCVNHSNIVSLLDAGDIDGMPYGVFELIDGDTLRAHFDRQDLSTRQRISIVESAVDGLIALHRMGIAHLDFTPANILVTRALQAKVIDFGLARQATPTVDDETTGAAIAMGSPGYVAPEILQGKFATLAADVYSVGCILHEALTGKRAPECRLRETWLMSGGQPDRSIEVVRRCLQTNPNARYPNAMALHEAVRSLQTGGNESPSRIARVRPSPIVVRPLRAPVEYPGLSYVAAIVTEGLTNRLASAIQGTSVGRTTSCAESLATIGLDRDRRTRLLVVGRLLGSTNRVCLQLAVVRATDRARLWGAQFEEKRRDSLTVGEALGERAIRALRCFLRRCRDGERPGRQRQGARQPAARRQQPEVSCSSNM